MIRYVGFRSDGRWIASFEEFLVGQVVGAVTYRQTAHGGLLDVPTAACHEVDLDVVIQFSAGNVFLTWGRENMAEGIAVDMKDEIRSSEGISNIDAGRSPQWRKLIGQRIRSVEFGWQTSEPDSVASLWSLRFDLALDASVVVALGELDRQSSPTYFPDSLVVIFDEDTARAYTHEGAPGTAWAT